MLAISRAPAGIHTAPYERLHPRGRAHGLGWLLLNKLQPELPGRLAQLLPLLSLHHRVQGSLSSGRWQRNPNLLDLMTGPLRALILARNWASASLNKPH